jgi:N-acetylmuramoyl-L-alanine amidase
MFMLLNLFKSPETRETPAPDAKLKPVLVLIVGHERKAPGAAFALGGYEYHYNSKVAELAKGFAGVAYPGIRVEVVFRDGVGIAGAYKKANALKPDACIELHYNAFNKVALGTETLCTVDSKDQGFAKIVHKNICVVFERGGMSRGVKVLPRSARGGGNIYAMPAYSNCLVEPFFGDNPSEAKLAQDKQSAYAKCLIYSFVEWSRSVGLINDLIIKPV